MAFDLNRHTPKLIAAFSFFTVLLTGLYMMKNTVDEERFHNQEQMHQAAHLFATAFEREVHVMSSIPQILHAQFQLLGPDKFSAAFSSLAVEVQHSFQRTGVIIAMAPAGEVSQVYPATGQRLVGMDLLQGGENRSIHRALEHGPVLSRSWSLIPGEQMLIMHYPVFHPDNETFWGLITALAPMDAVLRQSNLEQLGPFDITLKRTLSNHKEQTFLRTAVARDKVESRYHYMDLPDGDWQLLISMPSITSIKPVWLGWSLFFASIFAMTVYRLAMQPQQLRAEVAARTSELANHDKFLNDLISSLPVGIVVTDSLARIRYSNPVFNQIMAHPVEEDQSLISLLEVSLDNANMRQFLVSRISLNEVNFDVMVKLGEHEYSLICTHIDTIQGNLLVWVFRDMTEISRINRTLRGVSATRADMLRLISDPMAFFNKKGELMESNPSFEALFSGLVDVESGFSCEEFEKQLLRHAAEPDKLNPVFDINHSQQGALHLDTLILAGHPQKVFERTVCFDNSSNTVGSIMHFRDVTDAFEVDRMKTEFLSTAAHELRTPLANIFGYTELLIKAPLEKERQQQILDTVYNQAKRLSKIIDDLLDLARIEAGAGEPFNFDKHDLSDILQAVNDKLAFDLREHKFEFLVSENVGELWCDAIKIEQVIENLLNNAIKYSPEQSLIQLSCEAQRWQGVPGYSIEVIDQGIGMSRQDLEKVFDRFFRAENSGQIPGTGLGMAIVKEIITFHHGHISINSEPGLGTAVKVWFSREGQAVDAELSGPELGPRDRAIGA